MGRTACTEPQCLYKDALYLFLYSIVTQSFYFVSKDIQDKLTDRHDDKGTARTAHI